jgi:hypothetical protein
LLKKLLARFAASVALLIEGQKRPKDQINKRKKQMKNNLVKISLAAIAFLFIAAGQNSLCAQAKADSVITNQSANRLVGAWETTVNPVNCTTGEPAGPPCYGVITFNEGGTIAEFGANPAVPYRTPGHGIWASTGGGNSYIMKFSFLPLTPAGAPVGRMRVSQEIELNRFSDESSSSGSFVLSNLAGVVLATGCSTSTATRVTF